MKRTDKMKQIAFSTMDSVQLEREFIKLFETADPYFSAYLSKKIREEFPALTELFFKIIEP